MKRKLGRFGRLLFVSDHKVALLERLVGAAWRHPGLRSVAERAFGASLPVMDSLPQVHRILKGIPQGGERRRRRFQILFPLPEIRNGFLFPLLPERLLKRIEIAAR